jgi:hypothetical protein
VDWLAAVGEAKAGSDCVTGTAAATRTVSVSGGAIGIKEAGMAATGVCVATPLLASDQVG